MEFAEVFHYTQKLNVLYVEDNKDVQKETLIVLEMYFKKVISASNGQEALELYQEHFKQNNCFDLVITDIVMPKMDGEEFIKNVHQINIKQEIIVISSYSDSQRLINLIQNNISNFIIKPINLEQLSHTLYSTCRSIVTYKAEQTYHSRLKNMNRYLQEKIDEQINEIYFTQKISIETIANLIEVFDDDTANHIKRVEYYVKILVENLPQSYKDKCTHVKYISVASILHDVGKIFIPKAILNKKDPLLTQELEIIKTHAKLGGAVLQKANKIFYDKFNKDSYLQIAADIATYHHEKWDGTGYPNGLKANEIPLSARIVSIADIYDALRSKRVYKEQYSHQKAFDLITKESGHSFDPKLIEIFSTFHEKFEHVFDHIDEYESIENSIFSATI